MPARDEPTLSRRLAAALFVLGGVGHFAFPSAYRAIVPPSLPAPGVLVAVSGVAEVAGGVGLLMPRLRRAAGWGLVALLVAVFPANVHMALNPGRFGVLDALGPTLGRAALWARLPLQAVLIAWVWDVALRRRPGQAANSCRS